MPRLALSCYSPVQSRRTLTLGFTFGTETHPPRLKQARASPSSQTSALVPYRTTLPAFWHIHPTPEVTWNYFVLALPIHLLFLLSPACSGTQLHVHLDAHSPLFQKLAYYTVCAAALTTLIQPNLTPKPTLIHTSTSTDATIQHSSTANHYPAIDSQTRFILVAPFFQDLPQRREKG